MIVGTSCKTSYNVLSYSYVIIWWLGQSGGRGVLTFGGGGGSAKERVFRLKTSGGWHF